MPMVFVPYSRDGYLIKLDKFEKSLSLPEGFGSVTKFQHLTTTRGSPA